MQKRCIILVLVTLFFLLAIKSARADSSAPPATDLAGQGIEDTWHAVALSGLMFAGIVGALLTALRIRSTRALQESGQGGSQQLGLSRIPAQHQDERSR
jgi:hypothetical protein